MIQLFFFFNDNDLKTLKPPFIIVTAEVVRTTAFD